MALLKVLAYPDPFLKTKAVPVIQFDAELERLLHDMAETMVERRGIGLAATQVGSNKNLFVMDLEYDFDDPDSVPNPIFVINPRIIAHEGTQVMEEGCLSVPEFRAEVSRYQKLTLAYQDAQGQSQEMQAEGLKAVCIQHEMDHLKGKLFIDYLPTLKRKMVQKRLKKLAAV